MKFSMSEKQRTLDIEEFALELVCFICKEPEFMNAMITDESRLFDFRMFNPKNAYKEENGFYFFKAKYYQPNQARKKFKKPFFKLTKEEKESLSIEREILYSKDSLLTDEEIVTRVNQKYNSNINVDDLKLKLYELAYKVKQKEIQ